MADEPQEAPEETQSSAKDQLAADAGYVQIRRSHLYLALIPVAAVLGLAAGYLLWGQDTPASQNRTAADSPGASASEIRRIDVDLGDDPSIGPAEAPITIVEFSDFNCPFCRQWHQEVSQALFDTFPGQIRFVYKDFPIVGGGRVGFLAAQAAQCAEEQGAYWEYHDALFSGAYALDSPGFEQAAQVLELDGEALIECVNSGRYGDEVREDFDYGVSLGVSSTPTFFINNIPLVGAQPLLNFIEVIDGELGK
ncbi:MAG: DsbA family protein [Anaerolineales bacterium]